MPFLVLGDPTPDATLRLAAALVDAGADLLEFGLPFSDPPADGPVIQAADVRALQGGMTTARCFDTLRRVRAHHPDVPIALLVYFNLVLQPGVSAFFTMCRDAGVDAVLIADLPLEAAGEVVAAATLHDVAPVFVASELSSDARLQEIGRLGGGYVYVVAHVGTTGERSALATGPLATTVERVRRLTGLGAACRVRCSAMSPRSSSAHQGGA